jgi:hypothetical protein
MIRPTCGGRGRMGDRMGKVYRQGEDRRSWTWESESEIAR